MKISSTGLSDGNLVLVEDQHSDNASRVSQAWPAFVNMPHNLSGSYLKGTFYGNLGQSCIGRAWEVVMGPTIPLIT